MSLIDPTHPTDQEQRIRDFFSGSSGTSDNSTNPVSNVSNNGDALSQLYDLAQSNPEYMETYLQLLAERENTTNAQQWYEKMSNTSFSRMINDIEKAGYNPMIAFSSLGGAGSGSVQPAGTWSSSPVANKYAKEKAKMDAGNNAVRAIAALGTAVLAALAMFLA